MKRGGVGHVVLPEYRGISTASAAVHSPPPSLWQTTEWGLQDALPPPAVLQEFISLTCSKSRRHDQPVSFGRSTGPAPDRLVRQAGAVAAPRCLQHACGKRRMARLRHRLPAGHGDLLDLPPHRRAARCSPLPRCRAAAAAAATWSTTARANWRTAIRSKTYCASSSASSRFCWDSATSSAWWPRRCRRPPPYRPAREPPAASRQSRRSPGRCRHRCHHRSRRVHPRCRRRRKPTGRAAGRRATAAVFIVEPRIKRGNGEISRQQSIFLAC